MLVNSKDVIGQKVLTKDRGEIIGTIKDLVFDPKLKAVRALIVDSKGLLAEDKYLPIEDVLSFGEDAVVVEDGQVLASESVLPADIADIVHNRQYLTSTRVYTEDGKDLGKIEDIEFKPVSGGLAFLVVGESLFQNIYSGKKLVQVRDLVTLGKDTTIVRSFAAEKFSDQEKQGGVRGLFEAGSQKVRQNLPKTARQLKAEFRQVRGKAKATVGKVRSSFAKGLDGFPMYERGRTFSKHSEYTPTGYKGGATKPVKRKKRKKRVD